MRSLLIVAAALGAFATLATPALAASDIPEERCLPASLDITKPTPFVPTPAVLKQLLTSYRSPEVVGLSDALTAYAAGTADDVSKRSLGALTADDAKRHFFLLDDEANPFGGFSLRVVVAKQMYRSWVYRLGGDGAWQVRAFDKILCSSDELAFIQSRYGDVERTISRELGGTP